MKKILFVVIVMLSVMLNAEIDFNLQGAGARAAGMGGAFIGIADDATAVSWNPAGLTQLEKPEISFVGRFNRHVRTLKYQGEESDFVQNSGGINFISAAFPISKNQLKFVGSLSLQNQLDFAFEDSAEKDSGGANSFNIGFGVRPIPVFSLGLSLNLWGGKYEGIDKINDLTLNADISGFNLGTGLMLDLNNMNSPLPIKFGICYKKPFELTFDYKDYNTKLLFEMPSMIGFGSSIRLGDNFTFDVDYEIKTYKDKKMKCNNGYEEIFSYYNLNQLRIGAEFLIVTDFAVIPLRAGYFTEPTLDYIGKSDNSVGPQINGNGFSAGTGLIFGSFSLDTFISVSSTGSTFQNGQTFSGDHRVIFHDGDTLDDVKTKLGLSLIIYF